MFIDINQTELHPLLEFVFQKYTFDFRGYSLNTLKRRVERFVKLFGLRNIHELIQLLENNPAIFDTFRNELTVNTTEMFRDETFWRAIKQEIIPQLALKKEIRIWHNGCSTGEEVYSLAILLENAGILHKASITGTDINTEALKTATKGEYKKRYVDIYNENYKKINGATSSIYDYGTPTNGDQFQFNSTLRNKINFHYFDDIQGYSEEIYDLILSRNVLIYFTMGLQNQVMSKLFHNLNHNGFIAFGIKENLTWSSSFKYLKEFNSENKIYQK